MSILHWCVKTCSYDWSVMSSSYQRFATRWAEICKKLRCAALECSANLPAHTNWLDKMVYHLISSMDKIVLNAELKSTNSIAMYLFLFSRCVKTEWKAAYMASSVDLLALKAYGLLYILAGMFSLMCMRTRTSKHFSRIGVCHKAVSVLTGHGWHFRYRNDDGCLEAWGNSLLWGWDVKNVRNNSS